MGSFFPGPCLSQLAGIRDCLSPLTSSNMPHCRDFWKQTPQAFIAPTLSGEREPNAVNAQFNTCTWMAVRAWLCTSQKAERHRLVSLPNFASVFILHLPRRMALLSLNHSTTAQFSCSDSRIASVSSAMGKNLFFSSGSFECCSRAREIKELNFSIRLKNYMRLLKFQ